MHENYKNVKNIVEAFSEDWAEIRSAVRYYYDVMNKGSDKRRDELDAILDNIYTGLYLHCSPVILIDKDGRYHGEYKHDV